MEADADLEKVLVIDDRDAPLTLTDETACEGDTGEQRKAGHYRPGAGVF